MLFFKILTLVVVNRELASDIREKREELRIPEHRQRSLEHKLQQQNNLKMQKVQQLERSPVVWGPVLTEVKVSDQGLAAFVEMQ
eukprot:scaffold340609_cov41-Prasinocladus_malaysianus.AAC.1